MFLDSSFLPASGVNFLGWVNFLDYKVLRTTTKKRMFRNIGLKEGGPEVVQSYLGLLSHGNGEKLRKRVIAQGGRPCVIDHVVA
ncbi:MAG: hypothetical protein HZA94_00415 [Candidatus Vogelbacteria bacterium]|nr:hypothetical protein [Candidatus Vogelbacteria bacterium]